MNFNSNNYSDFLATISCDFEKNFCSFYIRSNGDNSSINGLEWRRHNGKYIEEQKLDGPYKGTTISK